MIEPSSPVAPPIATDDLGYLSMLVGLDCMVPDKAIGSAASVDAFPEPHPKRPHSEPVHRPSILEDNFLDSKDSTLRESLSFRRDDTPRAPAEDGGAGAKGGRPRRAHRSLSLGRIKSGEKSSLVRRISSTPKLKGLNEHSPLGPKQDASAPPWIVQDDPVSKKDPILELESVFKIASTAQNSPETPHTAKNVDIEV
jgi:hypothetical protein